MCRLPAYSRMYVQEALASKCEFREKPLASKNVNSCLSILWLNGLQNLFHLVVYLTQKTFFIINLNILCFFDNKNVRKYLLFSFHWTKLILVNLGYNFDYEQSTLRHGDYPIHLCKSQSCATTIEKYNPVRIHIYREFSITWVCSYLAYFAITSLLLMIAIVIFLEGFGLLK